MVPGKNGAVYWRFIYCVAVRGVRSDGGGPPRRAVIEWRAACGGDDGGGGACGVLVTRRVWCGGMGVKT